jgi:hypothetical protein
VEGDLEEMALARALCDPAAVLRQGEAGVSWFAAEEILRILRRRPSVAEHFGASEGRGSVLGGDGPADGDD